MEKDVYYYQHDYLSNVRAVVREDGSVVEENNYYPYGLLYPDKPNATGISTGIHHNTTTDISTRIQPYTTTGKELDTHYSLNWLDYGARQYMPDLGQWTSVDPLAEKYYHISPYAYCANNPMRYSPSGVPYTTYTKTMLPPYGDDPRDQKWIKLGIDYWKRNY